MSRAELMQPLFDRRERLRKVLAGSELLLSQALPGTPAAIVEAVRGLGLEGVVAKRKDSLYEPGERSGAARGGSSSSSCLRVRGRRIQTWTQCDRRAARRLLR